MTHEEDNARRFDFRRLQRHDRFSRMLMPSPNPSHYGLYESAILIAIGLVGGFGLGLAYAMFVLFA
jgi:hypothetical protein